MDQELSDRLITAFPHLYRSWQGHDSRGVLFTRQDFECENGWFELLWRLSAQLDDWIAALPEQEQQRYIPLNIKEKWGMLRIYLSDFTPEMEHAIRLAEEESSRIFERCGAPGTLFTYQAVVMTRCSRHHPARDQEQHAQS